jgi:hypothetical protein
MTAPLRLAACLSYPAQHSRTLLLGGGGLDYPHTGLEEKR